MNKKLKAKIIEHYGSQFLFSVFMNIHESEVSRVIRGRRPLRDEDREKWAEALSVKPEELGA
jgi:hypothetical protein